MAKCPARKLSKKTFVYRFLYLIFSLGVLEFLLFGRVRQSTAKIQGVSFIKLKFSIPKKFRLFGVSFIWYIKKNRPKKVSFIWKVSFIESSLYLGYPHFWTLLGYFGHFGQFG